MSPERPSVSFFSWLLRVADFPSKSSRHLAISSSDLLFSSCWRFLVEAWTWSIFFSTCLGSSRASLSSKSVPFSMMTCSSSPSPIVKLVAAFLPFCALIFSTSSLAREVIPLRRRDAVKDPPGRAGGGHLAAPHPPPPHLRARSLHAALVADDPLVAVALVLAAVAFPVALRAEDPLAKQPVSLRLQGAVVDRLRLGHLAVRPRQNGLGRCQRELQCVEVFQFQCH